MSFRRWVIIAAAGIALPGCNTAFKEIGQEDPFLGESVRYNAAVQTINPDPIYPEGSAEPGENGARGAAAVRRYRSDQVNARHQANSRTSSGERTTSGPN